MLTIPICMLIPGQTVRSRNRRLFTGVAPAIIAGTIAGQRFIASHIIYRLNLECREIIGTGWLPSTGLVHEKCNKMSYRSRREFQSPTNHANSTPAGIIPVSTRGERCSGFPRLPGCVQIIFGNCRAHQDLPRNFRRHWPIRRRIQRGAHLIV